MSGFLSNTVGVIDAETHRLLDSIAVGPGRVGLAVTPDGAHVYVTQRPAQQAPTPASQTSGSAGCAITDPGGGALA